MSRVVRRRSLSGAAAPAGITCLLSGVVVWALAGELAMFTAAGLLLMAGLWCLGSGFNPPAQGQITYEEPTR